MKVFFKSESNNKVGGGHLKRSIVLAKEFNKKGIESVFIFSESPESVFQIIRDEGFEVITLAVKDQFIFQEYIKFITGDSLIIFDTDDHRFYSGDLINNLRSKGIKTACFTVTDKYFISTDYLINPNIISLKHDYNTPSYNEKMLGPGFMIFRDEFRDLPDIRPREFEDLNLLLVFGNADPHHLTSFFIDVLDNTFLKFNSINIVAGKLNTDLDAIRKETSNFKGNVNLYINTRDILSLYLKTDIAITAGGMAMWEMALFAIPQLVVASSEREIEYTDYLSGLKYVCKLGDYYNMKNPVVIARKMEEIINNDLIRRIDLDSFKKCVNPHGVHRIINKLLEISNN